MMPTLRLGTLLLLMGAPLGCGDSEKTEAKQPSAPTPTPTATVPSTATPRPAPPPEVVLEGGLRYQVTETGAGPTLQEGGVAVTHLRLTDPDTGIEYWSGEFEVEPGTGQAIVGLEKGLVGSQAGEKRRIDVPPDLGFQGSDAPASIPKGLPLRVEVTVQEVRPPATPLPGEAAAPVSSPSPAGS